MPTPSGGTAWLVALLVLVPALFAVWFFATHRVEGPEAGPVGTEPPTSTRPPTTGPGGTFPAGSSPNPPPTAPGPSEPATPLPDQNITDVDARWTLPDGRAAPASVPPWTDLRLRASFTLRRAGAVALHVWGDAPLAFDPGLATLANQSLPPGRHTLEGPFTSTPDILRGFVPALSLDGNASWSGSAVPPRLPLDVPWGTGNVTNVTWFVGGQPVWQVTPGTAVVSRVVIRAENGDFQDEVTLRVRRDVSFAGDSDQGPPRIERVRIANGTTATFDVPFNATGGGSVRGFYVKATSQGHWWCHPVGTVFTLGFCGEELKLSFQQEGYPPRLRLAP